MSPETPTFFRATGEDKGMSHQLSQVQQKQNYIICKFIYLFINSIKFYVNCFQINSEMWFLIKYCNNNN